MIVNTCGSKCIAGCSINSSKRDRNVQTNKVCNYKQLEALGIKYIIRRSNKQIG